MRLDVDGERIDTPTVADVVRSVADTAPYDGWVITAIVNDDNWLEAEAGADDLYRMTFCDTGRIGLGEDAVPAAVVREMLAAYLARDPSWRGKVGWKAEEPPAKGVTSSPLTAGSPPWWVVVLVPGSVVAFLFSFEIFGNWLARIPGPRWLQSTEAQIVTGFALLCFVVFLGALIVKLIEERKASRWTKTMGRIVTSKEGFELTRTSGSDMPRNERVAQIAYAFEVGEETFTGRRISLAERIPESEVADLLKRYPEGKIVAVYYDPADPTHSILERGVPEGLLLGCLAMTGFGIAGVAALVGALSYGPQLIKEALPNAVPPLLMIFGGAGSFLLLLGIGLLRGQLAARRWPKTSGRVTLSEVQSFSRRGKSGRPILSHMPVVEFVYTVKGREYRSRMMRLDTEVAGSKSYAERLAAKYPSGKIVTVMYDAADPSRGALEVRAGLSYFMLALAGLLLLGALWSSGLLTDGPPLNVR